MNIRTCDPCRGSGRSRHLPCVYCMGRGYTYGHPQKEYFLPPRERKPAMWAAINETLDQAGL